jgi:hypothetical protein
MTVSATVWWFFPSFVIDNSILTLPSSEISYPPTRTRSNPEPNGSDLLVRYFFKPDLGVCCVTRIGPIVNKQMMSRAERAIPITQQPISYGPGCTLHYTCVATKEDFFSSVDEVIQWINDGPILLAPTLTTHDNPNVTCPSHARGTTTETHTETRRIHMLGPEPSGEPPLVPSMVPAPTGKPSRVPCTDHIPESITHPLGASTPASARMSSRTKAPRDFLQPKLKGKVYSMLEKRLLLRKQRVSVTLIYPGKQRVPDPEHKSARTRFSANEQLLFQTTAAPGTYKALNDRFRARLRDKRNSRVDRSDIFAGLTPGEVQQMFVTMGAKRRRVCPVLAQSVYDQPMPKPDLPPITYRKSHMGPHSKHWLQADAEEMERLFTSGTLRPIHFRDIPSGNSATYVNLVCSEKLRDTGAIKFRTRATIGGDQVDYPYSTTAVTANLECIKILLNAMISDDINLSTIDLEDFYLGANLPHPEYIRIPIKLLPKKVIDFYKLRPYIHKNALYCAVLKTHYGLPQAGALSQERLFAHLLQHGYTQLPHSQALFRNKGGSIRFSLVVDDFAVIWSKRSSMDHLIKTLCKLYTVKVNWEGSKYLGMNITIDRPKRCVTLSMPGYVDKLLHKLRPLGLKPVTTPAI